MIYGIIYITVACVIGFIMAWGVGANDLANIMSTTMGSKSISVRQATLIAIIFEFAGAFLGGNRVTATIREGIININLLQNTPEIIVYGMIAISLAATIWIIAASFFGLPVSITNAIVGGLVGFGAIVLGAHAIHWSQVKIIACSWIFSPAIAGIVAYLLFRSIQSLILISNDPVSKVRRYSPIYFFLIGVVLSFMVIIKGLKHFDIHLNSWLNFLIAVICGLITMVGGFIAIKHITPYPNHTMRSQLTYVEKVFGILVALTACAMVFAHGSNDVAIAIGPMSSVISIVQAKQTNHSAVLYSHLSLLLGSLGVIIGLLMYGRKVIATVGSGITTLTPSRAFAATIAAATTVVISTGTGIPVSATQTLVGAIFGVGLARGIEALNLTVIRNILLSWIITLPAVSLLAILFYLAFRAFLV